MTKYYKQLICLLLSLTLVFSVVGCKPKGDSDDNSSASSIVQDDNASSEPEVDTDDTTSQDDYTDTNDNNDYSDYDDYDDYDSSYVDQESSSNEDTTENESEQSDTMEDEDTLDPSYEEDLDDLMREQLYVLNASEPINKNFLGINGVYQMFDFMPDPYGERNLTEKETLHLYDRFEKMGVGMIRSVYSSGTVWDWDENRFNWNVTNTNEKINETLKGFYRSLKELQNRGIDVALAVPKPYAQIPNSTGIDPSSLDAVGYGVAGDEAATLKNYHKFIVDTVINLEANGINNVKYLMAFTEFNNMFGYSLEDRKYDKVFEIYGKSITALDSALKAAGKRDAYKIVGPCDNNGNDFEDLDPTAYSLLSEYVLKNHSDKVDIIGTHNGYAKSDAYIDDSYYYTPEIEMGSTFAMAREAGKDFWIDEYNAMTHDLTGTKGLEWKRSRLTDPYSGMALGAVVNGIMNMGTDNVFIWALSNQQWPSTSTSTDFRNGMHITTAYQPAFQESTIPYNSWYSLSLLTKYIGRGTVYQSENAFGIYISTIKRNDGNWSVVVTNYNVTDTDICINFEESMGRKTFYRHQYNPVTVEPTPDAEIIPASKRIRNVTNKIKDTIPGCTVTVYTTVTD